MSASGDSSVNVILRACAPRTATGRFSGISYQKVN